MNKHNFLKLSVATILAFLLLQNLQAAKNIKEVKDKPVKVEKIRFIISAPVDTGWDKKTRALGGVIKKLGLIKNVSYENIFYENPQENGKLMDFKGVHELIEHASKNKDAMLMFSNEIIVKYIQKASQYSFKDMAPIASFLTNNRIFVVRSDSPYSNWKKFLKAYKANYENYKLMPKVGGWGSSGSVSYLVFAKAIDAAGGDIVYINYYGFQGKSLKKALDEKKVDLIVTVPYSKLLKEHKEGKVKIIAITSKKDVYIDGLKEPIPSFKASLGINVVYKDWSGLFAIPNLDPKLATAYANIIKKALQSKEWKAIAKKNHWRTFFRPQMEFGKFLKFQTEDFIKEVTIPILFENLIFSKRIQELMIEREIIFYNDSCQKKFLFLSKHLKKVEVGYKNKSLNFFNGKYALSNLYKNLENKFNESEYISLFKNNFIKIAKEIDNIDDRFYETLIKIKKIIDNSNRESRNL